MRPPSELQGRVAGIRLQTAQIDTAIFGVYFAPTSVQRHGEIARKITKWLDDQIDKLGVRTNIIVGGDVNSDFGLSRDRDGSVHTTKSISLGGHRPKLENQNGLEFREFCERNQLFIASASSKVNDTFFGPTGGQSRIDHIAFP
eukprot:9475077-Pyramimonas_sp.AAC.1